MTGHRFVAVAHGVRVAAATIAALADEPAVASDAAAAAGISVWRKAEYLAVRALLRRLLATVVDAGVAGAPLGVRPGGQPFVPTRPELAVSLSHTDGWVAAAVHTAGGQVGVDVQAPVPASERLVGRLCTPTARNRLAALPPTVRPLELAWIWSVQEACVKATGRGVAGLPWTVPVEVGQPVGRWQHLHWSSLRGWLPIALSCAYSGATAPHEEAR